MNLNNMLLRFSVLALLIMLLFSSGVSADDINLNYVDANSGVDNGPQDGVFDSFSPSLGAVTNNGWSSLRTAFEFNLSSLPPNATINSASLTINFQNTQGTRTLEMHGYAGDGTVQLSDFALNGLVAATSVGQKPGWQTLTFDVTSFVTGLVGNSETFAGFNFREEPANTSNYLVMYIDFLNLPPVLSIEVGTNISYDKVYWTSPLGSYIQRANLDGSDLEDVLVNNRLRDVELDLGNGMMYWPDNDKIRRADLDGNEIEDIITGLDFVQDVALDLANGKIYWCAGYPGKVQRANLDGSNIENVITGETTSLMSVAIDPAGGKVYWIVGGFVDDIKRANLDGSNIETLFDGNAGPTGLALDLTNNKMYWVDSGLNKIYRANLDGSSVEVLIASGLSNPRDVALDLTNGKMYWPDDAAHKIQRANLDGSNMEDVVNTGLDWPFGVALDVASGKIYWVDDGTNKIQQANLNGSSIEDLFVGDDLHRPSGFAIDNTNGKMYWTDRLKDIIQKSDIDGSNLERIITSGLETLEDIAVDETNGKIYWADRGSDKIQRANLDGSNVEYLVSVSGNPTGIALDVARGKMYWTDTWNIIRRANLDGSNVEVLISSGLSYPKGIDLDVAGSKMYWCEREKIRRANLDGSGIEDLVTSGLDEPVGIVLDVAGGKMYWTDEYLGKIQRANLDGSNVEDLVSGIDEPRYIALGSLYQPDLTIDPNPCDLGQVELGGSNIIPVMVENTSGADLVVNSIVFNNNAENEFTLISRVPPPAAYPITVQPGGRAPLKFVFTPINAGAETATLVITSESPQSPHVLTIRGECVGAGKVAPRPSMEDEKHLIITGGMGFWQRLYFDAPQQQAGQQFYFDLPPVIEGQIFDARFRNDSRLTEDQEAIIELYGENYPITITAANLRDHGGKYVIEALLNGTVIATHELYDGQTIEINDQNIKTLRLRPTANNSETPLPQSYALEQNYPNPFNPTTTIRFALPEDGSVSLKIYNAQGQLVRTLVSDSYQAGYHNLEWDTTNDAGLKVASGIYFYRLVSGDFQQVKKMLLLK